MEPYATSPDTTRPHEAGEVELNAGREKIALTVVNTGDRPVQVGSHYHFFEVNKALEFNREASFGKRLDIPSGTAVRFEPGQTKDVTLCVFGGRGEIIGLNALTNGPTDTDEASGGDTEMTEELGAEADPTTDGQDQAAGSG